MFGDRLGPLSSAARALLARERQQYEDEALKARALARARKAFQADRPSGIGLLRASSWSAYVRQARRRAPVIAALVAAAGLAAAAAGVYRAVRDPAPTATLPPLPRLPRPAIVRAKRLVQQAPSSAVLAPPELTPPLLSDAAAPARPRPSELWLLEPARSSIGRSEFAAALSALTRHRHEYPNGKLAEEREALRVRALWGVGQKPAALAAAAAFRKSYPRSVLLGWMKDQPGATAP